MIINPIPRQIPIIKYLTFQSSTGFRIPNSSIVELAVVSFSSFDCCDLVVSFSDFDSPEL